MLVAVVAAVLLATVVAGVVLASGGDGIGSRDAASTNDGGSVAVDPRPVPEFTADLRGGGTLASDEIEGPAMIQVFASWCPSCQAHAPLVTQVQEEFGDDLRAYYVNVADEAGPAAGFLDDHGWRDAPVLVDDDRSIAGAFGLTGQPHTIFLDADGNVVEVLPGGGELGALQAAARRVLDA